MQQQLQNSPFKLVTDKDETLYLPEEAFELDNVRIEKKDSYFIVNLKEEKEAFKLPNNYSLVAIESYNEIYYLVAINPSSNLLLVGSYPSINPITNRLDKVFRPFKTYTADQEYININTCFYDVNVVSQNFIIPNIGIELKKRELKVYSRKDGSVNILLLRPKGNMIFNSGFNNSGYTQRGYFNNNDLAEQTYLQLNESTIIPTATMTVNKSGSLLAGSYTFYARYKSLNGGYTSYRKIGLPVNILDGQAIELLDNVSGEGVYGTTNKSITVSFTNTSNAYPFIELAVLYAYGETASFKQAYKIQNDIFKSNDYTLYDNSDLIAIELGTLAANKTIQKGCESGTFINDRFIGVNWSGSDNYNQVICDYVADIFIEEDYYAVGADNFEVNATIRKAQHSIDMERSYLSGESYAFLAHPVFLDGTIGLGYPMKGRDNWDGTMTGPVNNKGIFRFSNAADKPMYNQNRNLFGKRPKFNMITANLNIPYWITQNIRGFVFSQAKQKKNLLYQGFVSKCYNGGTFTDVPGVDEFYTDTDVFIPLIEPKSFNAYIDTDIGGDREVYYGKEDNTQFHGNTTKNKYALFSSDFMIDSANKKIDLSNCVLMKVGDFTLLDYEGEFIASNNNIAGKYVHGFTVNKSFHNVNTYEVSAWSEIKNNSFSSKVGTGSITGGWYYFFRNYTPGDGVYQYNLPFATPAYIGIEDDLDDTVELNLANSLCCLYRQHPEQVIVANEYNIETEIYTLLPGIAIGTDNYFTAKHGDSYPQRSTFKTISSTGYDATTLEQFAPEETGGDISKGFGLFLSTFSENRHNNYGRVEMGGNTYYPASSLLAHLYTFNQPESFFYNYGYDFNELYLFVKFDAKSFDYEINEANLVAHTDKQTADSNEDGFRNILAGQQKVYNLNSGAIKKCFTFQGKLLVIHEQGAYIVAIDERVPIADGSNVVIGNTTYLNEYSQLIAAYGTQYLFGAVQTTEGVVYGIDVNKQSIWRIRDGFELLSQAKLCERATHQLIFGTNEDNAFQPIAFEGYDSNFVQVTFDERFKEVIFTVHDGSNRNLVFSLLSDEFIGKRSSGLIKDLNNELITYNNNRFYLPYGEGYKPVDAVIGIVVTNRIHQQYHAHYLMSTQEYLGLLRVDWTTVNQNASTISLIAPMWYQPIFKNGLWFVPIPRSVIDGSIYKQDSVMAGDYLKAKFTINQIKKIELKGILTNGTKNIG